jgi:hypothetical protein
VRARGQRAVSFAYLALSAGGIALTIALSPARVFVTDWRGPRASRVLLLPHLTWVFGSIAVAAVMLGVLIAEWRRRGGTVETLGRRCSPLRWLWVVAVPFVPLASDFLPALTILAGPFRWLIVTAALMACLWPQVAPASRVVRVCGRSPSLQLFLAALAIYVGLGVWVTRAHGIAGDEPHYLILTESLARRGCSH